MNRIQCTRTYSWSHLKRSPVCCSWWKAAESSKQWWCLNNNGGCGQSSYHHRLVKMKLYWMIFWCHLWQCSAEPPCLELGAVMCVGSCLMERARGARGSPWSDRSTCRVWRWDGQYGLSYTESEQESFVRSLRSIEIMIIVSMILMILLYLGARHLRWTEDWERERHSTCSGGPSGAVDIPRSYILVF